MGTGICVLCGGAAEITTENATGKMEGFYRVDCPRCGANDDTAALTYWVDPEVNLDALRAEPERARRHLARNARVINKAAVIVAHWRTA